MLQYSFLCKKIQKIKNYIVMICKKVVSHNFSTINYNLLQFHNYDLSTSQTIKTNNSMRFRNS